MQVAPLDPSLAPLTDVYFRGYDQNYPDLWRYNEWKREFDQFVAQGNLPSLSLVRVSHDHMGSFGTALGGVNTPETQQADDDLAVGRLVQAVAESRYAADTLIIVTEDDCQDGPDHVDSHRATAYVVGPYVKQGRGRQHALQPGQRAAHHRGHPRHAAHQPEHRLPAADDRRVRHPRPRARGATPPRPRRCWRSTVLAQAPGGLGVKFAQGPVVKPKHDAQYWAKLTAGFDFSDADRVLRQVQPGAVEGPDGRQAVSDPGRGRVAESRSED